MTLIPQGRFDEAFAELKRGIRLDPLSPVIHASLSWAYLHARLYDKAIEQANRGILELDAAFPPTWYPLGLAKMLQGDPEPGIAALKKGVELSSSATAYVAGLGWGFARAGRRDEANSILDELLRDRAAGKYVMAAQIAMIYGELQKKNEALRWLEEGYQERSAWMIYLNVDPRYDNLRFEPRFQELLRRMKFAT
jgi:tetratricopeptide (TPR) repeat protein